MRVLFVTWAWPSHYYPMVPLAWALRASGHEVMMASQPSLAPTMLGSGLSAVTVGRDVDIAAIHQRDLGRLALAERGAQGDRHEIRALRSFALFTEIALAMADDFVALARSWGPDLIIYDPCTFAGPLAARLTGVPALRHLFGPDIMYFATDMAQAALPPLTERYAVAGLDPLGAATIDPCPPHLQFPDEVTPVRRIRIRYVAYNGLSSVPGWLLEPARRPRICLTWGTSVSRLVGEDASMPGELLRACADLAAERGAELLLLGTREQRGQLPDGLAGVRLVESVPLQLILAAGCAALIHPGGAGTMLTALSAGVPQLVVPQLPDQVANAGVLAAAGAGVLLHAADADAAAVRAAAGELLDAPGYRHAAGNIRQEIAAQPAPAQVIPELAELARAGTAGERPALVAAARDYGMPLSSYQALSMASGTSESGTAERENGD
jgi:UDP:flavonoid glycosyltransferase YjiC (YdhE family)